MQAPARGRCPASSACSTRTASARAGSTIRARASWSPIARADRWFTYYYWLDDARAPDFARTVDIHRKPGYDPVELFLDPALRLPEARRSAGGSRKKALGFRYLMDVIPLDATSSRARTAARRTTRPTGPLVISSEPGLLPDGPVDATAVKALLLDHVFGR